MELFRNLGFERNPFSRFSAEEEKEYLNKIYIKPKYYKTLFEDIKDGSSRFILGERGIGKTALMMSLEHDLRVKNVFSVIIDEYDDISRTENERELVLKILRKIVTKYGIYLANNRSVLKKLDKTDKEKIAFFIKNFFESISPEEYQRISENVSNIKGKKLLASLVNSFVLKPINMALNGASYAISDAISRSLGLPQVTETFYKNYLPEMTVDVSKGIDIESLNYTECKKLLKLLIDAVTRTGHIGVVIFMDKIDEYRSLGANIKVIADFIKGLASDTSLLQIEKCSFVFVLWSKVKEQLNTSGIRYDKFKPIDITWRDDELLAIMNKRLSFFAEKEVDFKQLFETPSYTDQIMKLSNKSPRQLLMLLSKIYDEQEACNETSSKFKNENVKKGIELFASYYDFLSMYPTTSGTKGNILGEINTMLRVEKKEFGSSDLVGVKKYSVQAANNELKIMKNYGLIKEIRGTTGKQKMYRIQDPVICFMIENNIPIAQN